MNKFKKYNRCIYCGSKKIIKEKKQHFPSNFYLKAIKSDLSISENEFRKIKVYRCDNCFILQNNPWFSESVSHKIYSNIYGQHNKGWSNMISFFKEGKLPNHGKLFELLDKRIKINNYAEFNSPFMGLFLDFFAKEYKKNNFFYKQIMQNTIGYLSSRQAAGRTKKIQKESELKSKLFLDKIIYLKNKNKIKKHINKFLFTDNSSLCWGQNDNYKSVNSKSFASEVFNLKILDIEKNYEKINIDLFGIFLTLDHTFEPSKILNFGLNKSKYVIVNCHIDPKLNKQHLFSLTKDFLRYLNKNKIYTLDLTNKIEKKLKSPELYFLCSRKKIMNI